MKHNEEALRFLQLEAAKLCDDEYVNERAKEAYRNGQILTPEKLNKVFTI